MKDCEDCENIIDKDYRDSILWVGKTLEEFDFVQWDRFTRNGKYITMYGWIERETDFYKDFIVLMFNLKTEEYRLLSTSSAKYDGVFKEVFNDLIACERVEHHFQAKNVVRLK